MFAQKFEYKNLELKERRDSSVVSAFRTCPVIHLFKF